jgi:hypothetical protein
MLERQKKIPALRTLLQPPTARPEVDPRRIRTELSMLSEWLGIPLRRRKKPR